MMWHERIQTTIVHVELPLANKSAQLKDDQDPQIV
jgi:hypothetical protein